MVQPLSGHYGVRFHGVLGCLGVCRGVQGGCRGCMGGGGGVLGGVYGGCLGCVLGEEEGGRGGMFEEGRAGRDVRLHSMLNSGHFGAPSFPRCFYHKKNFWKVWGFPSCLTFHDVKNRGMGRRDSQRELLEGRRAKHFGQETHCSGRRRLKINKQTVYLYPPRGIGREDNHGRTPSR